MSSLASAPRATRAGNAYTTALLVLIVLLLLTLIFGALSWLKHDEAVEHRTGFLEDPEQAQTVEDALVTKVAELEKLQKSIAERDRSMRLQQQKAHELSVKVGSRGMAFDAYTAEGAYDPASGKWLLNPNQGETKDRTRKRQMLSSTEVGLQILQAQKAALSDQNKIFEPLEKLTDDVGTESQKILREIQEIDAASQRLLEVERAKKDELEKERSANDKAHGDRYSELATQISQARDRIRELLELELRWVEETLPDGRVRSTDSNRRYTFINLGANDRVFNGMVFQIFQYVKGRMVHKGWCEVIETESETANCRVTEEVDPVRNPIAPDDMIGNPVFSTTRPLVFHFAGEFRQYNKADLESFVARSGGETRAALEPGVDFLVVGDGEDTSRTQAENTAREYHILAMKESQLVPFLYRTFTYKPDVDAGDGMAAKP